MEWGKLFANLPDDPRVQAVQAECGAAWMLVESMCYLTRSESGGRIPFTQVEKFGGGSKLRVRVAALVREGLWIKGDTGYDIDPDLWSEERNLSDSAEKKRKADRERMRAKREEKAKTVGTGAQPVVQGEETSRDSRATCRATDRATDSRDSRTLEKSREEKKTPPPPAPPELAVVPDTRNPEEEGEEASDERTPAAEAALIGVLRQIHSSWSADGIRKALDDPENQGRPWPVVREAFQIGALDPETRHPGRLPRGGDWWAEAERRCNPQAASRSGNRPVWCEECDSRTRLLLDENGYPGAHQCPRCHPKAAQTARSA